MTAHNPDATSSPIPSGFRKTEKAAIERRQRNTAPADIRAARAAVLAENETRAQATREAETRAAQRPVEVFRDVLAFAADVQLEELHRSIGRIDSRSQQAAVADIIVARARARHAADIAASSLSVALPSTTAEASENAPGGPVRGRGRPRATHAA